MESKQINNDDVEQKLVLKMRELTEDEEDNGDLILPNGMIKLETQVAGHFFDPIKNTMGMLRCSNGCVLKSGGKDQLCEREIKFYEKIQSTDDLELKELINFTSKYYGTIELNINNKQMKFIKLEDITDGMMEPCVMDIKIGKRTWDPLAGPEKHANENQKYSGSKKTLGFCIPGFQVYNLETGNLTKFNKDYGKKLNDKTVVEALKIFLNLKEQTSVCRELVIKLLSPLWKILSFFRSQKKLRFYSSSLLIAYDVKLLRQLIRMEMRENRCVVKSSALNTNGKMAYSTWEINNIDEVSSRKKSSFSWSPRTILSHIVRRSKKKRSKNNELIRSTSDLTTSTFYLDETSNSSENLAKTIGRNSDNYLDNEKFNNITKLCRTHSYTHNYERDMIEMKDDYAILLQELTGQSRKNHDWVRVCMIDFTHVFPAEDESLDLNFLEGVENLTKILESLLIVN